MAIRLDQAAYELLKRKARNMWRALEAGRYSYWMRWSTEEKLLFLGFLRGYTLYREIPENEGEFWPHFYRELGLEPRIPSPAQYDALWDALTSHPQTRPHLVTKNGRRLFVVTIDRIWGARGLKAHVFAELFRRYWDAYADQPVDTQLLQKLNPELPENVLRQADAYDRIFRGLVRVLEVLKRNPSLARAYLGGTVSEAELEAYLQEQGLVFSHPNPISFLRHKSEATLRSLIEHTVGQQTHHRGAIGVAEGDRPPKRGSSPVAVRIERIEGLEGSDLQIVPNIEGIPLLEGHYVTGEVQLIDGRWARFQWRPQASAEGEPEWSKPIPSPIKVDDVVVDFSLRALEASAVRLRERGTQHLLDTIRNLDTYRLEFHTFGPAKNKELWFSLRSSPGVRTRNLEDLVPAPQDVLLVEYDAGYGHFVLLGHYPIDLKPKILDLKVARQNEVLTVEVAFRPLRGAKLEMHVKTPTGTLSKTFPADAGSPVKVDLTGVPWWFPLSIEVEASASTGKDIRSIEVPVTLILQNQVVTGIAWSRKIRPA